MPVPPFPAILMLPFIATLGIQGFNTTTFSLELAATSAVIVYLILYQLIRSGWIKLSNSGAIWLTALFSFGTMYWFLSIDSRLWYFAQVVTVLFSGLAFLSALKKWSSWITGILPGSRGNEPAKRERALAGISGNHHTTQLECARKNKLEKYIEMECSVCDSRSRWCRVAPRL